MAGQRSIQGDGRGQTFRRDAERVHESDRLRSDLRAERTDLAGQSAGTRGREEAVFQEPRAVCFKVGQRKKVTQPG